MVGSYFFSLTGLDKYIYLWHGGEMIEGPHDYDIGAFLPTLVGGYIMALVTFPAFYYSFFYMITGARAAKTKVGEKVHVIGEKVHDIKEHRKEAKQAKKEMKNK